jgi:predicted trehalose synthase
MGEALRAEVATLRDSNGELRTRVTELEHALATPSEVLALPRRIQAEGERWADPADPTVVDLPQLASPPVVDEIKRHA